MNTLELYIGTLRTENTKTSYRKDLTNMLKYIGKGETEITLADLLSWIDWMNNEGKSSATIARRIGSCKRYFDFLFDIDVLCSNPSKKLKPPKIVNRSEPTLTSEEVGRMIDVAKNPRDKAIVATLASTGMRISELLNVQIDDFDGDDISIVGKGNKRRLVHINEKTMGYIEDYLKVRKDSSINNLFVTSNDTPLHPDNVNRTLKNLANKAGINKNVHNHSLRHMFATTMLDNHVPIERIQLCMGHSDISVTTRYAKIRNEREVVRDVMNIETF